MCAMKTEFCFEVPVFITSSKKGTDDVLAVLVRFHGTDKTGYAVWSVSPVFLMDDDRAAKSRRDLGVEDSAPWRHGHCLKSLFEVQRTAAYRRVSVAGFRYRPLSRVVETAVDALTYYLSSLPKIGNVAAVVAA